MIEHRIEIDSRAPWLDQACPSLRLSARNGSVDEAGTRVRVARHAQRCPRALVAEVIDDEQVDRFTSNAYALVIDESYRFRLKPKLGESGR